MGIRMTIKASDSAMEKLAGVSEGTAKLYAEFIEKKNAYYYQGKEWAEFSLWRKEHGSDDKGYDLYCFTNDNPNSEISRLHNFSCGYGKISNQVYLLLEKWHMDYNCGYVSNPRYIKELLLAQAYKEPEAADAINFLQEIEEVCWG